MDKEKEIMTTTKLVEEVLTEDQRTRSSDDLLYIEVCKKVCSSVVDMPFWRVILNRKEFGIPPIESVTRIRRKLQDEHTELGANVIVKAGRMNNEEVFREYAKG